MKEWAYITDQLITTHPIVSKAFDTDMAIMNFDGITYSKGASVIRQLQFYVDYFIFIAHTEKARDNLLSLLNTSWLDQPRRWKAIQSLSRLNAPGIIELIESELQKDATSMGQTAAIAAKMAFPNKSNKEEAWNLLTGTDEKVSFYQRSAAAKYFHNPNHPELSEIFVDRFFDFVCKKADWSRIWYVKDIFGSLFPHNLYSEELLAKSQNYLKEMKSLSPAGRHIWLETNEVLEKRVKVRKYNQNWLMEVPMQYLMKEE